jgi:hypothetical protein
MLMYTMRIIRFLLHTDGKKGHLKNYDDYTPFEAKTSTHTIKRTGREYFAEIGEEGFDEE